MAIALGTQATGNTSGTTQNVNLASCAAGDLIVVCAAHRTDTLGTLTVSDPTNGTYTIVATNDNTAIAYFANSQATGTLTITVAHTGASAVVYVNCSRWTGAATSSVLSDSDTGSTATVTDHAGPSITAPAGGVIVHAACASASIGPFTADTGDGFALLTDTGGREAWQYKLSSGETVTPNITSTTSGDMGHVVAAFAAAGEAPPTATKPKLVAHSRRRNAA